jgi:hypothetical protein
VSCDEGDFSLKLDAIEVERFLPPKIEIELNFVNK